MSETLEKIRAEIATLSAEEQEGLVLDVLRGNSSIDKSNQLARRRLVGLLEAIDLRGGESEEEDTRLAHLIAKHAN